MPQSYLTFVSGTLYNLDTMELWRDMKLEEEAEEGIVFNDLQAHNANYTVAGVTYADGLFMQCEITFENTGSNYSVKLINSNNDIFDEDGGILVATPGLTIIPGNAAGLVLTDVNVPALSTDEAEQLEDMWTRLFGGRLYMDPTGKEVITSSTGGAYSEAAIYSDDGATAYDGTSGVAKRDDHVKP